MFRDREAETAALGRVVEAAQAGASSVLVVRGEGGIGKSALLDHLVAGAAGVRVVRAAGVESEMELAFAGLHQLCAPLLDALGRLSTPQQDALKAAFGLGPAAPPDRFFVGLAVLGLLSYAALETPLLCVVDDAQWLDRVSLQSLAFAARRLRADSVGLVFAIRDEAEESELTGLPELRLEGLPEPDARELLASVIPGPLDERVRDVIIAETGGNPLALLELPRGAAPTELAGGFGIPAAPPLADRIEESFRRRVSKLPADTQQLLLIAAAEPAGDPMRVWRACALIGIDPDAAVPAETAGLVELGSRIRFRHPLVRSAVYRDGTPDQKRRVHRALGEATDREADPDRRAWHLAQAAPGPDESVAADLVDSADRAQARGGLAAAAAFLERAAALTPDPLRQGVRALAAAQAKHLAGAHDASLRLLRAAQATPLDELQHAQVDLLRAQIDFAVNRGRDAPRLLVKAAKRFEPLDVGLARETYLDALGAAWFAGRLTAGGGLSDVAAIARAAPPALEPRAADLLLEGLATRLAEGYAAGAPLITKALLVFRDEPLSAEEGLRWLWLACTNAHDLWDDETWVVLADRHLQLVRQAGALTLLPIALSTRGGVHMYTGNPEAAAMLLDEVSVVTEATGTLLAPYGALTLAAMQGREAEAARLADTIEADVEHRGEGLGLEIVQWSMSLLHNGLGRYEDALVAARSATGHPYQGGSNWGVIELVEAAARTGNVDSASAALAELEKDTRASGSDWALGIEARSRALVSRGEVADGLYREAITRLGRTRIRVELARAHLLYGEWLRSEGRPADARQQLSTAHQLLTTMGMDGFAERAARGLVATGEKIRRRPVETRGELTPQELQIARLARDRLSNPEIGARLFISPRTVEYHLHKVFTKLAIGSRTELATALDHDGQQ